MSVRPVVWGVLGVARIATAKVIPAMKSASLVEMRGIASRDGAKARAAAAELGLAKSYASYEALLADPEIEAVYNPLPNHLHVPWTVKAMEAGKHVLCEKPVAMDAAEAERLLDARRRTGRVVAEAFMVRFHPQWRRVREIAVSGGIGDLRGIQTQFCYNNPDPANVRNKADIGGGGLYDIGCYAVLTARHVFGAEPVRVACAIDRDPAFGTDRLASGIVEFPGARQLVFTVGTQTAPVQRVAILGSKGRIEIPVPFNPLPTAETRIAIDDARDLYGGGSNVETFGPCDPYALQGEAFSRAVRGLAPLEWPIEDAVANMRVIDALFRAGKSGRFERV
jgi:predicted dehydrogenase